MGIDLKKLIEEMGDPAEVHKGLVDYERRSDRMMAIEERLTKDHPDEWVAMARDGTVVFADSLEGVLGELDEIGASRGDAVVHFLAAEPQLFIL